MDKTIEQRAEEYAPNTITSHIFKSSPLKGLIVGILRDAYIAGAKEQKKIDRVHFKKWYCKKICYKRKECQSPSIMCYRLGQIVKEIENI